MTLRVAFLSAGFPWPPVSGGDLRTIAQLKVLSTLPEVGQIRFLAMSERMRSEDDRDALCREVPKLEVLDPVFHPIHLFRHPRHVPRVAWLRAFRGVPYMGAKWDSASVRKALRRELSAAEFDVVWLNGLGIAYYLGLVRRLQPKARIVLDQQNVEHLRFAQFAARQRGPKRWVAEAEWRAARRYERDILRRVDAVGAISDEDARAYQELAGVRARTVPQVAFITRPKSFAETGQRLCWIGGLSWEPNARGIDWFCAAVWPLVRERLPGVSLDIVGVGLGTDGHGAPIVPAAWRLPGITTLGFVEDLSPIYARSVAMIAPILGGSGIRIKLIEAFRNGIPVVTTPDGAAGLAIQPGREAFVESDAGMFAKRVVDLVTSAAARAALRDAAFAFLDSHNRLADAQAAIAALLGSESPRSVHELPAAVVVNATAETVSMARG